MLADELLEDAFYLSVRGQTEKRNSCMRRAISTAYYAVFHLLIDDFVKHWEFEDQRARLARMFDHGKMRNAAFSPRYKYRPTAVIAAFAELQVGRTRADYDLGWNLTAIDVQTRWILQW